MRAKTIERTKRFSLWSFVNLIIVDDISISRLCVLKRSQLATFRAKIHEFFIRYYKKRGLIVAAFDYAPIKYDIYRINFL